MSKHKVLLVEDNEDDIFFMRMALNKAGLDCSLDVVEDGEAAIGYLSGKETDAGGKNASYPSLVLLDLKIPRINGLEVLKWIRNQPDLSTVVVIMLTSSRHAKDVTAAAREGANSFLVKPSSINELVGMMRLVNDYWFGYDQLVASPSAG